MFAAGLLAGLCACGSQSSEQGEPWTVVFEDLDGALMSITGRAPDDVWTVGADTRDGEGSLVLHFDGERWTRVPTGVESDLWWVHVLDASTVVMGGSGGTVLRHDGELIERMSTPGTSTVWGIWGTAEDDLWAVGGDPDVSPGFVWRFDGSEWRDVTAELPEEAGESVLFKVFGRTADDVWIVGMDGVTLHWDGESFALPESGTRQRLFTIHGATGPTAPLVAVGGFASGLILEHDGTEWHDVTPEPDPMPVTQLFGVCMDGPDHGYAVGYEGAVLERKGAAWKLLDTGLELFNPFHAVWVDSDGGVWAVGGDVLSPIPVEGMLVHRGKEIPNVIED